MADLDHRIMTPPSLRIAHRRQTPSGDNVYVWDFRIAQPNVSHIAMPIIHSLEHFCGDYLRRKSDAVINVAPMGCQTGFYIVASGIATFEQMSGLLADALASIADADAVPLANSMECGWAENHSLIGVQELADWLLRRRSEWPDASRQSRAS